MMMRLYTSVCLYLEALNWAENHVLPVNENEQSVKRERERENVHALHRTQARAMSRRQWRRERERERDTMLLVHAPLQYVLTCTFIRRAYIYIYICTYVRARTPKQFPWAALESCENRRAAESMGWAVLFGTSYFHRRHAHLMLRVCIVTSTLNMCAQMRLVHAIHDYRMRIVFSVLIDWFRVCLRVFEFPFGCIGIAIPSRQLSYPITDHGRKPHALVMSPAHPHSVPSQVS